MRHSETTLKQVSVCKEINVNRNIFVFVHLFVLFCFSPFSTALAALFNFVFHA